MIQLHFVFTLSAEAKKSQLLLLVQFTREPFHPHLITYTMSQAGLLRSSLLLTNYDHFEGLKGANIHFGFFSAEVWDVAVPDIVVILMMLFLDHRYWCSVGAGVDVLAVSCIIDQRQMVVRGQSEMRNASHETSHVLPVSVQRDLLHPTWRSLKSKSPTELDRYMYTHYHSKDSPQLHLMHRKTVIFVNNIYNFK